MEVLITAVGVPGHLNPVLSAAAILGRHHDVAVQTPEELPLIVQGAYRRKLSSNSGK